MVSKVQALRMGVAKASRAIAGKNSDLAQLRKAVIKNKSLLAKCGEKPNISKKGLTSFWTNGQSTKGVFNADGSLTREAKARFELGKQFLGLPKNATIDQYIRAVGKMGDGALKATEEMMGVTRREAIALAHYHAGTLTPKDNQVLNQLWAPIFKAAGI